MPITIKQNTLKYKDPTDGEYHGMDAVSDHTTSESIALIQQKGQETRASIPDDYTTLSDKVDDLDLTTVKVTTQSFDDNSKSRARTNIGAASSGDLNTLSTLVNNQGGYISDLNATIGTVPTGETVEGQITDLKRKLHH